MGLAMTELAVNQVHAATIAKGDANLNRITANDNYTIVTPANFLKYFTQNGNAINNYDDSTGIQIFTTTTNQVGNITFNGVLDLNESFEIKGAINVGLATSSHTVADGIGFAFYQGERDQYSDTSTASNIYGGNVGIYGVPNVFGWKADTYANNDGVDGDSDTGLPSPYGAFVQTNSSGYGTIDKESVKNLANLTDGKFHQIDIKYDASTKMMQITLNTKQGDIVFDKNLDSIVDTKNPQYSFSIIASTGALSATQSFQLESMDYVALQTATINYVDENTGQILKATQITGKSNAVIDYPTKQIEAYVQQGYEVDAEKSTLNSDSQFDKDDTTNQNFYVYLKHKTSTVKSTKDIKQTIHYQYTNGTLAAADIIKTITFVNETTTDEVTKKVTDSWSALNGDKFAETDSPIIKGYTASIKVIPETTTLSYDSTDQVYTVTYVPNDEEVKINFVDSISGKSLFEKTITGKYGTVANYQLDDDLKALGQQGYTLESSDIPVTGILFNRDDEIQTYTIKVVPKLMNANSTDTLVNNTFFLKKVEFIDESTNQVIKSDELSRQQNFYPIKTVTAVLAQRGYVVNSTWNGTYSYQNTEQANVKVAVTKTPMIEEEKRLLKNFLNSKEYETNNKAMVQQNKLLKQSFTTPSNEADVNRVYFPKTGGGADGTQYEVAKMLAVLSQTVNFGQR